MKKTSTSNSHNAQVAIGTSIGIAAVAAGAYFLFGPKGKKHRADLKGWTVRMKGEILEKLEEAKEVTEPIYHGIVDDVAAAYAEAGKIPSEEVAILARDLKKHWKAISNSIKSSTKSTVKKVARKVNKKISG